MITGNGFVYISEWGFKWEGGKGCISEINSLGCMFRKDLQMRIKI